jgi:hypothetical protein
MLSLSLRRALPALAGLLVLAPAAAAQYQARITQIDRARFPHITVYVAVADAQGKPLPAQVPLELEVLEGGRRVHRAALTDRPAPAGAVSVVLVLDISGSMRGDKLARARAGAEAFVRAAPGHFEMALISFDDTVQQECGFTRDKGPLLAALRRLNDRGATALQDALGRALELLQGRPGRRAVIALTDGVENASRRWPGASGQQQLLTWAARASCSISMIGLGRDVQTAYLKRYEQTGGHYLASPTPAQLVARFEVLRETLKYERSFSYTSPTGRADGLRQAVAVRLLVAGREVSAAQARYVAPGLIPNVRGRHAPYLLALLALLLAPRLLGTGAALWRVARFRWACMTRLQPGSKHLGRRDPNVGATGPTFAPRALVVLCPCCEAPHHVRSWRLNGCRCMREGRGAGRYCYAACLPGWLRRALHRLTGRRSGEAGRSWLCRCAGDAEGY